MFSRNWCLNWNIYLTQCPHVGDTRTPMLLANVWGDLSWVLKYHSKLCAVNWHHGYELSRRQFLVRSKPNRRQVIDTVPWSVVTLATSYLRDVAQWMDDDRSQVVRFHYFSQREGNQSPTEDCNYHPCLLCFRRRMSSFSVCPNVFSPMFFAFGRRN